MPVVFIGLGSNLDDPAANLKTALDLLPAAGFTVLRASGFLVSKPYGPVAQPDFLNAVCLTKTSLTPLNALYALKALEQQMGRLPSARWGPRLIDLDILLYDNLILNSDELTIPHKDMLNRRFVLAPLACIAAGLRHPVSGKTVAEHLAALPIIE